jgi:hypothetical protein
MFTIGMSRVENGEPSVGPWVENLSPPPPLSDGGWAWRALLPARGVVIGYFSPT